MDALKLGPFALPIGPVLLLVAFFVSLAVVAWTNRNKNADVESSIWKVLIAAVLGARLVFVAMYAEAYKSAPWSILDIRDGGFNLTAGIIAASVMTMWLAWARPQMRKPFLLAVSAGAFVWAGGTWLAAGQRSGPERLPEMALARLEGGSVQFKAFAGKPAVVNLWASWCPPCRREMPLLRDAQLRYPDIEFVFANQGESSEAVKRYLEKEGFALRNVLLDPALELGAQTGSKGLPTTLFFDAKGMLIDRRMGELSAATLAQRIESLRSED